MEEIMATDTMSEWEKERIKEKETLKKAAEGSDSKVLKKLVKRDDKKANRDCSMVRRLVEESIDMYRSGDYKDLSALADDLCGAIKAID